MKKSTKYTVMIGFSFRNAAGEIERKKIGQDVTDDVAEGADDEALVESFHYHNIKDQYDVVDFYFGGVYTDEQIAAIVFN